LQSSNYKYQFHYKPLSIPLSSLHEDCHETSGYSYLRVATIRIDVHPAGENPTNTPHASHAQCMVLDHTYFTRPTHSNLSLVVDRFGRIPLLPGKMALDTIHNTSADRFARLYPISLPSQPMKQYT
jgi:hypothetical protein